MIIVRYQLNVSLSVSSRIKLDIMLVSSWVRPTDGVGPNARITFLFIHL